MWSNVSAIEVKFTVPAAVAALFWFWRLVTRIRDIWRLHRRGRRLARRFDFDLADAKVYAAGRIGVTLFMMAGALLCAVVGGIAMTIPEMPSRPNPNGNLLINALVLAQACSCIAAIADQVGHEWLVRATRRPLPSAQPIAGGPHD
jgi:hypothetical protein